MNNNPRFTLCDNDDSKFLCKDEQDGALLTPERTVSLLNDLQRRFDYLLKHGDDNNFGVILLRYSKTCEEMHRDYNNTIKETRLLFDEYIKDAEESSKDFSEHYNSEVNSYAEDLCRSRLELIRGELETTVYQKSKYIVPEEDLLWWKDTK